MTILGIDPGSLITGIGLVRCDGQRMRLVCADCLRAPASKPFEQRLLFLHDALDTFLRTHPVDEVAVEAPFYGVNVQTLMKMCHARGSLLAAVARYGISVHEYAPREIKKAVVGNGNASKEQVSYMVQRTLEGVDSNNDWSMDVTDAIAAALCRAHRLVHVSADDGGSPATGLADRLIAAGAPSDVARRVDRGSR
ncbi:MAG: crossover junction endodeoxyribonuclease RuvC [Candidatus Latescibacterota bacterium]|nr:crossover junction endodeoxyribonuclease RuvC [Candidatus Latescibacterota bacterium]